MEGLSLTLEPAGANAEEGIVRRMEGGFGEVRRLESLTNPRREVWSETLLAVRTVLRRGRRLVFETRNPAARAWLGWNRQETYARVHTPDWGVVNGWCEVTEVTDALVSFRWTYVFERDGVVLTSHSTLRFRSREEITDSLQDAGLVVEEVREAPDRLGRECVLLVGLSDGMNP